jgi:hypothetical protein
MENVLKFYTIFAFIYCSASSPCSGATRDRNSGEETGGGGCKGRELSRKERLKREREKRNEREFLCKRNFKRDEVEGKCEKL